MAEKKDVRIQLVMSSAELDKLDVWRAEHRIWSRSEAIRRLVARGIEADETAAETAAEIMRTKTPGS